MVPSILSSFYDLLPDAYGKDPSCSVRPIILRPVAPAEDSVVGLPSPGALENPAGVSRNLSSLAVMGESDPLTVPSNSSASSWNNSYECSANAGSMSMG